MQDAIVAPIPTYGPIVLAVLGFIFLAWLTFSDRGHRFLDGVVSASYVTAILGAMWIIFVTLVGWAFWAGFSVGSVLVGP